MSTAIELHVGVGLIGVGRCGCMLWSRVWGKLWHRLVGLSVGRSARCILVTLYVMWNGAENDLLRVHACLGLSALMENDILCRALGWHLDPLVLLQDVVLVRYAGAMSLISPITTYSL